MASKFFNGFVTPAKISPEIYFTLSTGTRDFSLSFDMTGEPYYAPAFNIEADRHGCLMQNYS